MACLEEGRGAAGRQLQYYSGPIAGWQGHTVKALPGSYNVEQWPPIEVHVGACAHCMTAPADASQTSGRLASESSEAAPLHSRPDSTLKFPAFRGAKEARMIPVLADPGYAPSSSARLCSGLAAPVPCAGHPLVSPFEVPAVTWSLPPPAVWVGLPHSKVPRKQGGCPRHQAAPGGVQDGTQGVGRALRGGHPCGQLCLRLRWAHPDRQRGSECSWLPGCTAARCLAARQLCTDTCCLNVV